MVDTFAAQRNGIKTGQGRRLPMTGDRERCIDAGMDDYIAKPINANELFERLEKWTTARQC